MDFIVELPKFTEFEKKLQNERDFFKYMGLLKEAKNEYIIIIVASDTPAGPLFTPEHSAAMMNALGLRLNMVQAYRQPYVAIIDGGEVIYEQTSQDLTKAITVDADFGEHKLFIHSGGFHCSDKFSCWAVLKVDDNCHYGGRGLNFYTFNSNKGYMADFFRWETFEDIESQFPLHKPFLDAQEIFSAIENNSNVCVGGGSLDSVIYCLFKTPPFTSPQKRSKEEQFMRSIDFKFGDMLTNEELFKNIWDNKLLHFCNDFNSPEDLKEAISTPDSYNDITGVLKFKDHSSNVVNTRNGIRITTNQPKRFKRAVFLVGLCTTFGVGADDSHTIASFLQRKLNERASKEKFIVYNYGYFAGTWRTGADDKLIPILSSLPTKKGDVVFLYYDMPLVKGLPFCDLTLKSDRPHSYGEIFLDRGHYAANGNKMIADGLFDFLKEHKFFKNATVKFTRQGAKDTPDIKCTQGSGHDETKGCAFKK